MTTIELFASKDEGASKSSSIENLKQTLSFKAFCKRFGLSIILFLASCSLFSYFLCNSSTSSNSQYFEQLEDLLEEVQLSDKLSDAQNAQLDQIAIKRDECLATCDFIRSYNIQDEALMDRISGRLGSMDAPIWSLNQAFSLLEKASQVRSKGGKESQALGALNDLKRTLDHKQFSKTNRSIFTEYLESIGVSL